jgi:phage major head subunit gpT-like protein
MCTGKILNNITEKIMKQVIRKWVLPLVAIAFLAAPAIFPELVFFKKHGFQIAMIVNAANLSAMFKSFNTIFNEAVTSYKPIWEKLAMEVPSSTEVNFYAWIDALPMMREWVDERRAMNLTARNYEIANKLYESTIDVPRAKIEDDQYGTFGPIIKFQGISVAQHPDILIFDLLNNGFTAKGWDGNAFFSAAHKSGTNLGSKVLSSDYFGAAIAAVKNMKWSDGKTPMFSGNEPLILVVPTALEQQARLILHADYISVSGGSTQNNPWKNAADLMVAPRLTSTTAWYILIDFYGFRPLIYQNRIAPEFIEKVSAVDSDYVYRTDKFSYGVRARRNAGYGLHQLAFGSTGLSA